MHASREESAHERMIHDGSKFGFHPAVVSHPENYILVILGNFAHVCKIRTSARPRGTARRGV